MMRSTKVAVVLFAMAMMAMMTTATDVASPKVYAEKLLAAVEACPAREHAHLRRLAATYRALRVESTRVVRGAVIDCVLFENQPALLGASAEEREAALATLASSGFVGVEESVCGAGLVGVTRLRLQDPSMSSGCLPRRMTSVETPTMPKNLGVNYTHYFYVIPADMSVPGVTNASVTLSVGVGGVPLATCKNNGGCHSLNQLWVVTSASPMFSLECGWIASNYFTTEVTTSIFAFSTCDGYAGAACDAYNLAGGFVMFPGSPITLGAPIDSVEWTLMYSRNDGASRFDLRAQAFSLDTTTGVRTAGKWYPVGYYPYSRYSRGPSTFDIFQAGCEIWHETMDVTASGEILGWATNFGLEPTEGAFSPVPPNSGFGATYVDEKWSPENPLASAKGVHFSGGPIKPVPSPRT